MTASGKRIPRLRLLAVISALLPMIAGCSTMAQDVRVDGTVWQPDEKTANPSAHWDVLGADNLLIQRTAFDDMSLIDGTPLPAAPYRIDWQRIGQEPWAKNVILGLATYPSEPKARANVSKLVAQSLDIARTHVPLHVTGYYFPVEVDPTWTDVSAFAARLVALPRPLWITVYDQSNIGPVPLADWMQTWLPPDIGVFFQDGCGVYAREPRVARQYLDVLSERFGKERIRVIAEAFRPADATTFRPATPEELLPQLRAYNGYSVYLFDGPHYVPDTTIRQLAPGAAAAKGM
ncbi:MAG TPA: hypothetical protein VGE93_12170 [Bryobacteraceae bacterium]